MNKKICTSGLMIAALSLIIPLSPGMTIAQLQNPGTANPRAGTLNPEAVNPHAEAPRKPISLEKKRAAANARKKKQEELAARKAEQRRAAGQGDLLPAH